MAKKNWKDKSKSKPNTRPVPKQFGHYSHLTIFFNVKVEMMQQEMVLAKERNDEESVRRLQMEILRSRDARVLAVERVVT